MKVLVTGGAGYIGSTICSALEDAGHSPVVLDSLAVGPREFVRDRTFFKGDIGDAEMVRSVFAVHPDIVAVIHCAALIVVPDSVSDPSAYYKENVVKSIAFFEALLKTPCRNIVFSSSASLYAAVPSLSVDESSPLAPTSPYARTKYIVEMVLSDFAKAYGLRTLALRYFNPVGADPKMRSGSHVQAPSHVLGKILACALGQESIFRITGADWSTRDGTGLRDYVHVWDLALAHVQAVTRFESIFSSPASMPSSSGAGNLAAGNPNYRVVNLGTGIGNTVKELIGAFERVAGKTLKVEIAPPRPGDVAGACANAQLAWTLLNWRAEKSLEEGIRDAITWENRRGDIL